MPADAHGPLALYFRTDSQRGTMKTLLAALVCVVAVVAVFAYAQTADEGFQMARVVSIDRVPADARHPDNADLYKISMRLGDTLYSCHASGSPAVFIDWSPGKEFPTKLNGKVLQVKSPSGQIVDLNIVGKKTVK
jgi:hypothetical protein